jgi:1-acyl-sn-glycerol-3-phosphate acyltransferase
MNLARTLRLCRIALHLAGGVAICVLAFPWLGGARRHRLVQIWSRQLLRIFKVSVEPAPGAPALAHALIAANHISWLDIFVINTLYPCRFVAKAEIRAWPLFGWLAAQGGTVFITRGNRRELRHTFKALVASLEQGERVVFFPEGTTACQGALLPFHSNLFEAAIDAKVAVQPYALEYVDADGALHPSAEFVGDTTIAQSIRAILDGAPLRARLVCLAPLAVAGAHRRALAAAAQASVASALERRRSA